MLPGDADVAGLENYTWRTNGIEESSTELQFKAEDGDLNKRSQEEPKVRQALLYFYPSHQQPPNW